MAGTSVHDAVCQARSSLQILVEAVRNERDYLSMRGVNVESVSTATQHALDILTQEFELGDRNPRSVFKVHQSSLAEMTRKCYQLGMQLDYQKRSRTKAEDQLALEKGEKMNGRVQAIWYVRAGLSNPYWPRRSLQDFFRDFGIVEKQNISHSTVTRVRDAMAEVLKLMNRSQVSSLAASTPTDGGHAAAKLVVYVPHIHDEALMRLRSYVVAPTVGVAGQMQTAAAANPLSRSRTSKIQNNVVHVSIKGHDVRWLEELQVLATKNAPTIATAVIQIIESVITTVCANRCVGDGPVRIIHCVTGDGITTNEAAMKRVLAHFKLGKHCHQYQYFLLVWRCSSHQSNLVVAVAICKEVCARPEERNSICCNCSRLYKYLIPDYCEDFAKQLRTFVLSGLRTKTGLRVDTNQFAADMQKLYGPRALPPDILSTLNGELGGLEVLCPDGSDRDQLCRDVICVLRKWILKVEEKPIVTRFFLFAECVFGILRSLLLGVPAHVFTVESKNPRLENQKRIDAFGRWYADPSTLGHLKVACLCLQLTSHCTSMTAKKSKSAEDVPTLVKLGRGEVQAHTFLHMKTVLSTLHVDAALNIDDAVFGLVHTECCIVVRFAEYLEFPTMLWSLTKRFNPAGYQAACLSFLQTPAEKLDLGYSAELQRSAIACGSLDAALDMLRSAQMQEELEGICFKGQPTSLDCEREHNLVKKGEATRVSSVASVSRNGIISTYRRIKNAASSSVKNVKEQVRKDKFKSAWSLAVQRNADLLPRPVGQRRNTPMACAEQRRHIDHAGDKAQLDKFYSDNKPELMAEAKQIRDAAKEAERQLRLAVHGYPSSNLEWLGWLHANEDLFSTLLKSACSTRRIVSRRLEPLSDHMPVAPRIYPKASKVESAWMCLVGQQYSGYFCLELHGGDRLSFFHCRCKGQSWSLVLNHFGGCITLDLTRSFVVSLRPLGEMAPDIQDGDVVNLWSLDVKVQTITCDGIIFEVRGAKIAMAGAKRKREHKIGDVSSAESGDDFLAEMSSGCESVCSDADSGAEVEAEEKEVVSSSAQESHASDGSDEQEVRAKPGTHTAWGNGYFTCTNDPAYRDAKIRLRPRWCTAEHLQRGEMSKAYTILTYDDTEDAPTRTYLMLRAWMLWRVQRNGFVGKRMVRRRWFEHEVRSLRQDIANLMVAGGGTGSAAADVEISRWMPDLM